MLRKFGVKWRMDHSLRDKDFVNELEHAYYLFLISNYGPNSCLSLIQNSAGENFLTSSSNTILKQLSFGHPCFKFINALISSQNRCHGAHGLFVGILCSGLLLLGLKNEKELPHRVLREISEWIQFSLLEELQKRKNKNICCKFNLDKLSELFCVTKTVVKSKSFYCLSEEEREHISLKIIETFLTTLPESTQKDFGQIHIIDIEGPSSINSKIISGILYRMPDYSIEELQQEIKTSAESTLKIIIFTIPLSHEIKKCDTIEWHSKSQIKNLFCSSVIKQLGDLLNMKGVKVIASQMYINDELKFSLRNEGFLVLERLGTSMTNSLIQITRGSPVTSLDNLQFRIDHHIGFIPAIEVKTIQEKQYLHIHSQVPYQNLTFILMAESRHTLTYLKESVESGVGLLRQLIRDHDLVAGAGCFEVFIAILLMKMKEENVLHLSHTFDTSVSHVKMVFDKFVELFLRLSILPIGAKHGKSLDFYVDNEVFHLWKISEKKNLDSPVNQEIEQRCACACVSKCDLSSNVRFVSLFDIKNSELKTNLNVNFEKLDLSKGKEGVIFKLEADSIVDSFSAKLNAIRIAFDGFSELFRLGLCIYDG